MSKTLISTNELIKRLKEMEGNGRSWKEITQELYPFADDIEVKRLRPMLWRIAHDRYIPKSNRLRNHLGLVFIKEVEACPTCNQVHLDRCPKVEEDELPQQQVKPRPSPRPPRHRVRFELPPDTTAEQREAIGRMTAAERLAALINYVKV